MDAVSTTADLHFIYYNKEENSGPEGVLKKKFSNRDFGLCRHFRENCTRAVEQKNPEFIMKCWQHFSIGFDDITVKK